MIIIDGKKVAHEIKNDLIKRIKKLSQTPKMKIVLVGQNGPSLKYVKAKINKANEIGIEGELIHISDVNIPEADLIAFVQQEAQSADGIIVQLPLPNHIDKHKVLNSIPFDKDIDGLAKGNNKITPATPRGIMSLLEAYNFDVKDKSVAVVGKSSLVGKPVALLCQKKGAHVTSYDLKTGINGTENADILIVAAGSAGLIKASNIKQNAVIIDVGINSIGDKKSLKKITGDVDRDSIGQKAAAISPVPGGVGPMTVISLLQNLIDVCEEKDEKH